MFQLIIESVENFDETDNTFTTVEGRTIQLEHSLVSLSKWESKWKKPFLSDAEKSIEETHDYIKCMTITQNIRPEVYDAITPLNIKQVMEYIEDPMTATTIKNEKKNTINREIITAEIVYYWMIALTIPFECQKWHLSRLLTLINVCNIKNTPPKKMGKQELARRNHDLNEARLREQAAKQL